MAKKSKIKTKTVKVGDLYFKQVDNPTYNPAHDGKSANPRQTPAQYNPKESPIMWMAHKGYLTASQTLAGTELRRLHEATGAGGLKAINYLNEPVDGGGCADAFTDRRMDAAKELARVKDRLGPEGYDLTIKVCGDCLWINSIEPTEWRQRKAGERLRECLTALAVLWGYQTGKVTSWRSAAA